MTRRSLLAAIVALSPIAWLRPKRRLTLTIRGVGGWILDLPEGVTGETTLGYYLHERAILAAPEVPYSLWGHRKGDRVFLCWKRQHDVNGNGTWAAGTKPTGQPVV